jgi:hypothetical protein
MPGATIRGYVANVENLGGESVIGFRLHDPRADSVVAAENTLSTHSARVPGTTSIRIGTEAEFVIPLDGLRWFHADSGVAVAAELEGAVS